MPGRTSGRTRAPCGARGRRASRRRCAPSSRSRGRGWRRRVWIRTTCTRGARCPRRRGTMPARRPGWAGGCPRRAAASAARRSAPRPGWGSAAASGLGEALPALRRCLGGLALDAEHVMVICDAAGRILWIEGHPRVKHRAEGITFTEGMLWTEDSAGTNAIGTALEIQRAVQVFSAEHFLSEQHTWWCSAAPIHDPGTGALLGVVDISGPMRTAHPHSLGLVSAAAGMAEDALRLRHAADEDRMRQADLERTARPGRHPAAEGGPAGGGAGAP